MQWDGVSLHRQLEDGAAAEPDVRALLRLSEPKETGSEPILFAGDDGSTYWAKWPHNPHGSQSLLHEHVVASLGPHLHAPTPQGVLLHVDEHLVSGLHGSDGTVIPSGTWFGLERVNGLETQEVDGRHRSNQARHACYLALWDLCMGQDAQFVYDYSDRHRVWSIDHGLWFDSLEKPWEAAELQGWSAKAWSDPPWHGSRRLPVEDLMEVADRVESITSGLVGEVLGRTPLQWGIPKSDLEALGSLIVERRPHVAGRLRARGARTRRGS